MNKEELDEDGGSSMTHVGETVCFRKIGEDGVSTFASRMTQGIFAGHHDPTGAILCVTKSANVGRDNH